MEFEVTPVENEEDNFKDNMTTEEDPTKNLRKKWRSFSPFQILKILLLLSFFLVIVAILVFMYARNPFNLAGINFEINGPTEASAGDEVIYRVEYSNNTADAIKDINLAFFYPSESVVVLDEGVSDIRKEDINKDILNPGEKITEEFKVFLVGDKGDIKTAKAVLSFKPQGMSSEFQKEINFATTISNSPINVTFVSPPDIVSGKDVTYILDYNNESDSDISDIRIEILYPEGFSASKINPSPSKSDNTWSVPSLKAGQKSRIEIEGILIGQEKEEKVVTAKLQRKVGDNYITYNQASTTTIITSPPLAINIKVNDQENMVVDQSETLYYSIDYRNNSGASITGIIASVKLEGYMYDFKTIETNGFFNSNSQVITWNASSSPRLGLLGPSDSGSLQFKIRLKKETPPPGSSAVKAIATIQIGSSNDLIMRDESVARLSAQPNFVQEAYHSYMLGGFGPVPPKVGQETTYTIRWSIENPGEDIENARVVGILPAGVKWLNETKVNGTTQAISYNNNTRQVAWDLGKISAQTGTIFPDLDAYFKISVTPAENQIGKSALLMNESFLTGLDTFTNGNISLTVNPITTYLVKDTDDGTIQE